MKLLFQVHHLFQTPPPPRDEQAPFGRLRFPLRPLPSTHCQVRQGRSPGNNNIFIEWVIIITIYGTFRQNSKVHSNIKILLGGTHDTYWHVALCLWSSNEIKLPPHLRLGEGIDFSFRKGSNWLLDLSVSKESKGQWIRSRPLISYQKCADVWRSVLTICLLTRFPRFFSAPFSHVGPFR